MAMYGKVKVNATDTLYSKIIRYGKIKCPKCTRVKDLQCCHIVGRRNKATRWLLDPISNAVPLCSGCHDWFDSHKIKALVFDERKRVLSAEDESFTFLVKKMGYSWEDLQKLFVWADRGLPHAEFMEKEVIRPELREKLKQLERGEKLCQRL